jgi:hypothetical protein
MWHTGTKYLFCPLSAHESDFCSDISILNVMMDGSMYPDGWHPCETEYMRDNVCVRARHFSRTERPPKYYFIDFGISRRYDPEDKAPLEPPIRGGDKTVPEFMEDIDISRNPFQTDIYYVGNLIVTGVMKVSKDTYFSSACNSSHLSSAGIQRFRFYVALALSYGSERSGKASHD